MCIRDRGRGVEDQVHGPVEVGVARLILQRPVERVGADKLLQRRCFLVVLLDAFDDLQDGFVAFVLQAVFEDADY